MPDPIPAAVSRYHEVIREVTLNYKRFDDCGRERLRAAKLLGKILVEQKENVQHGDWIKWIEDNCPFSRQMAARFMMLHTEKDKCKGAFTFEEAVEMIREANKAEVGEPQVDISGPATDDEPAPLTAKERAILIYLIGTVNPGLGHKLHTGKKVLSDADLRAKCPPSCESCRRGVYRGGPGRPCPICTEMRSNRQRDLFEEQQEPADENDPAAAPAAPDPYIEAKKLVGKLSSTLTKLLNEDKALYEALVACRVVDHVGDGPRFCAVRGVAKVIEMVAAGEKNLKKIENAYKIASGAFVPPAFRK